MRRQRLIAYDGKAVKRFALLLLPFCATLAQNAQEAQLTAIRDSVLALRKYANDHQDVRGGIPQLTAIKHQLRDWIDARLAGFPQNGDPLTLSESLHNGLEGARLFCDNDSDCFPTSFGFLDEIQVNREGSDLIVETAVGTGVRCGYDNSVYIYEWKDGKWQCIWQNEQDDYAASAYFPQFLHSVQISDPGPDGTRLILTLGTQTGCLTFRDVYYRVWRLGTEAPLLDKRDLLYDEGDPPSVAKLQPEDLRVEFSAGGGGYGYPHKALRHFEIKGATVKQIDPIAPSPHDFVDEWLAAPWTSSSSRAESPSLQDWHKKLHRDDDEGDYPDDPVHCTDPELWQISTHLEDAPTNYFLVRWRHSDDRMTMVEISDKPIAACKN